MRASTRRDSASPTGLLLAQMNLIIAVKSTTKAVLRLGTIKFYKFQRVMRMKKWFIMLLITSFACFSLAQTKPSAKKGPVPTSPMKQQAKKALLTKFSMSVIEGNRLDSEYIGLTVAQVVDSVEKVSGQQKGEFESTAEFNARKAAAFNGKLVGDSTVEDTFGFVASVSKSRAYSTGLKYDFNADTSELRLFAIAKSSSMNGIGAPDYKTSPRQSDGLDQFDWDIKTNSKRTFQASNAYGASVTVEETNSTIMGIAANRIPFLTYKRQDYYSEPVPSVQIKMENAKAATELPALKALVVMNLATPYIAYDFHHSDATRENPTRTLTYGKYLTGNVLGIIFYSGLTGEILARLPENFGQLR